MSQLSFDHDLVSIIVPAFRVENIITETIFSVVTQTYQNWELLIADDCSPDNTAAIVEEAQKHDSRVHLIKCAINGGPAAARNAAIMQAKGRWIAFLDSDDLWLPTKLTETINFAESKGAALTYTGFRRMTSDGLHVGHYISVPKTLTYKQLLGNTAIATSTVLIDRLMVNDIMMRSIYCHDFVYWLDILKKRSIAHGLNKDLMRYRVMANSFSRNKFRGAIEVWKTYRTIENLGYLRSVWHFTNYAFQAIKKYWRF